MISELASLWKELETSAVAPGITARRFLANAPVDVFVGIEAPGSTRLLFIEASNSAFPGSRSDSAQSAGVAVEVDRRKDAARARMLVRLTLPAYRDVFSVLVADLLGTLTPAQDETSGVLSFVSRLDRWQRLLARHGADGLSVMEQRGLYGELLFLKEFLLPTTTPDAALDSWTGPLAKDQDFQLPRCSVEVKVSSGSPDHVVHVSNVRQLDETASSSATLFLFHASLEERHGQGQSLAAIVDELRNALGLHVERLNDLLTQAGYFDVHAPRYAHSGYVLKGHRFYSVKDGFPRIREAELRAGVGDVRYAVQLGACAPFAVPDAAVVELIQENK